MARQHISSLSSMTLRACLFLAAILALHAQAQTQGVSGQAGDDSSQSQSSFLSHAMRQQGMKLGLDNDDMDNLLSRYALASYLLGKATRNNKRAGWKRIHVQTRFAPFGTKLIPSRNRGDSTGPTLLRYGRSSA